MLFTSAVLLLAFEAAVSSAKPIKSRTPTRVSLRQSQPLSRGALPLAKRSLRSISRRQSGTSAVALLEEDAGFWYGNFTVGEAENLSLLIDTGSSDAAVNPGLYKPTPASQNLHKNGSLRYSTTQENGCGTADIAYTEFVDTISFAGLTSKKQTFGNINPTPQPNNSTITQFPHQGLVGFAGIDSSEIGATPFFTNLCNQNAVSACRFGLALGTDNTGSQYLGELDSSQFAGALTTAPILDQWELPGDVSVAGKTITTNQTIILDSGTANVIGPISAVQDLFDAAGIQGVTQTLSGCTKVLTGYYPCASPPTVGFKFPAGADGKVFDILGSAFEEADDGAGNCTAIVAGIDFGPGIWIVGQAWFQGKYVDHDVSGKTLGFADLK